MNENYLIESVAITSNGRNELYFDVNWRGKEPDYFELRILDRKRECLECYAYASHQQRVLIKDFNLDLQSKRVNAERFYVELGVADYDDDGNLLKWDLLAEYPPLDVKIYYEMHFFRKNVLEIR